MVDMSRRGATPPGVGSWPSTHRRARWSSWAPTPPLITDLPSGRLAEAHPRATKPTPHLHPSPMWEQVSCTPAQELGAEPHTFSPTPPRQGRLGPAPVQRDPLSRPQLLWRTPACPSSYPSFLLFAEPESQVLRQLKVLKVSTRRRPVLGIGRRCQVTRVPKLHARATPLPSVLTHPQAGLYGIPVPQRGT